MQLTRSPWHMFIKWFTVSNATVDVVYIISGVQFYCSWHYHHHLLFPQWFTMNISHAVMTSMESRLQTITDTSGIARFLTLPPVLIGAWSMRSVVIGTHEVHFVTIFFYCSIRLHQVVVICHRSELSYQLWSTRHAELQRVSPEFENTWCWCTRRSRSSHRSFSRVDVRVGKGSTLMFPVSIRNHWYTSWTWAASSHWDSNWRPILHIKDTTTERKLTVTSICETVIKANEVCSRAVGDANNHHTSFTVYVTQLVWLIYMNSREGTSICQWTRCDANDATA